MIYHSGTVQNNILIKIELCSIDNHCTTGASVNGHSSCNQFRFPCSVYQCITIEKAINMQTELRHVLFYFRQEDEVKFYNL